MSPPNSHLWRRSSRASRIDPHALAVSVPRLRSRNKRSSQTSSARLQRVGSAHRRGLEQGISWRPPLPDDKCHHPRKIAGRTAQAHRRVRPIALRSDVPVALFLSGGIDSWIIAESAMRQAGFDTPLLGFRERLTATMHACCGRRWAGRGIAPGVLSADTLPDSSDLVSMPTIHSPFVAAHVWTLAREVVKDYKVAISGDGGDELVRRGLTCARRPCTRGSPRCCRSTSPPAGG